MIGVLVNCATVIAGGLVGLAVGKKINDSFKDIVFACAGLVTLVMGVQMALESTNFLSLLVSLLIGGFLGSALKIEERILSLGETIARKTDKSNKTTSKKAEESDSAENEKNAENAGKTEVSENVKIAYSAKNVGETPLQQNSHSNFGLGFLNASVLFCSGAMSVVGSIQAGSTGELNTILIKSVMDGFIAIVFASVYGVGVIFSAGFIFLYQGFFTLAGTKIEPLIGELGINELSATGGVLLFMIGFGILNIKKFKTANFMPALVFAPIIIKVFSKWF